jgi:serine/threonine protein kinase
MVSRFNSESEAAEVAVNALVGQSPFIAVLADFGGSLIFSDTDAVSMRSKVWTPLWSAPECYARVPISKGVLPKIDIYAAGLIFAFIILEGQDIFTRIVERGERHSQDVTMDSAAVKELKLADGVLKLAKEQVQISRVAFLLCMQMGTENTRTAKLCMLRHRSGYFMPFLRHRYMPTPRNESPMQRTCSILGRKRCETTFTLPTTSFTASLHFSVLIVTVAGGR